MTDLEASIERLQQSYITAVWERDVHGFLSLYDPSARIFDAWGVWQHQGAESWRHVVESWFSSLGTERVRVTFAETQSSGNPALAFVSAIGTYAGVSAEGIELRAMQNRMSWGLYDTGQGLRIVHEHTSVPVNFDNMKAILRRDVSK